MYRYSTTGSRSYSCTDQNVSNEYRSSWYYDSRYSLIDLYSALELCRYSCTRIYPGIPS
eukprot:COSAG05_NODE_22928_length_261_cov_0.925926_1_plen_58_part_10